MRIHTLHAMLATFSLAVILGLTGCASEPQTSTEANTAAPADPDSPFSDQVIDIGIVASDLERSLAFYQDVVGMKRTSSFDMTAEFGEESGLTDGLPLHIQVLQLRESEEATRLKIMTFDEVGEAPRSEHIHDAARVQYLTLFVKDMAPVLERIEAHGVELLGKTQIESGAYIVVIPDPDGNFIEFVGPMQSEN